AAALRLTTDDSRLTTDDSRLATGDCRLPTVLATVSPRDQQSESDVQAAEPGSEQPMSPGGRRNERNDAERHEAQPHDRHDAHRDRAAGRDRRAIHEQPAARQ